MVKTENDTHRVAVVTIAVIMAIGFILFMALIDAFVLTHLWRWFIEPLGLAAPSYVWMIGIALFARMLIPARLGDLKPELMKSASERIVGGLLGSGFILLIGYIIHEFMT